MATLYSKWSGADHAKHRFAAYRRWGQAGPSPVADSWLSFDERQSRLFSNFLAVTVCRRTEPIRR